MVITDSRSPQSLEKMMRTLSPKRLAVLTAIIAISAPMTAQAVEPDASANLELPTHCLDHAPRGPADYQEAFDHRSGGWAGADGAIPITLPGHRVLWLFGDTFVGSIDDSNALEPGWAFPRNTVQVQSGRCFTPVMGGTAAAPASFLPEDGETWFWPTGGYVDRRASPPVVRIVAAQVGPFSGGFGFAVVGTHIFTLSLPDLDVLGHTAAPYDPTITNMPAFGQQVRKVGNTVYLYGSAGGFETDGLDPDGPFGPGLFVARADADRITDDNWQYWTGRGWSKDVTKAAPMSVDGVSDPATLWQQDVVRWGRGYLLTARILPDGLFSTQLFGWTAASPTGPWEPIERDGELQNLIPADVSFPQPRLHYGGYLLTDVPGTSKNSPMLVFSTNGSGCGGDVECTPDNDDLHNVMLYGPQFVTPAGLS